MNEKNRTAEERWAVVERLVKGVKRDAKLVALSLPRYETFLYVVLAKNPGAMDGQDEWIVWYFNDQVDGLFQGSYGCTEIKARQEVVQRGGVFEGMPCQSTYLNSRHVQPDVTCPYCGHEYDAEARTPEQDWQKHNKLQLVYCCPRCGAKWSELYHLYGYKPITLKLRETAQA